MESDVKKVFSAISKKVFLVFLSLFLFTAGIFAQDKKSEEEGKEPEEIIWQTLEWEEEDPGYVTHYDIEIERYNSKTDSYEPHLSLKTENNSTSIRIEPQLACGVYRYKITSYDLLELPSAESDWNDLVIYQAYQPEVKSVSSNVNYSSTIYLEEYNDGIFNISGKNLFKLPETGKEISFTKYYLRKKGRKSGGMIPLITEFSADNKKLKIQLTEEQMDTGVYYFVAKDASGLENPMDSDSELVIKYKKAIDLNVSLGYSLPVILYDDTMPKYMDGKVWPISCSPKVTFIPYKHRWGYLGVGLSGNYARMSADFGSYSIDGNMITGLCNFVYQKPIYKQVSETQHKHIMTIEAHAGGGIVDFQNYVFTFPHNIKSEPLNSMNIAVDVGFAVQYFFSGRLYAEAEINYINAFVKDMAFGMIVPTLSVGWQF